MGNFQCNGKLLRVLFFGVWLFAGLSFGDEETLPKVPTADPEERCCRTLLEVYRTSKEGMSFTAEIEATLIYVNAQNSLIRIQDSKGMVIPCDLQSNVSDNTPRLKLGDRVSLRCRWAPGMRFLLAHQLEIVGHAEPIIQPIRWDKGSPAGSAGRYVEATGIVQEVFLDDTYLNLMIKTPHGPLKMRMQNIDDGTNYETLLSKQVRVRGAISRNFLEHQIESGFRLDAIESSQIQLVDVNEQPFVAIHESKQRIEGAIDALDPGRAIYVNGKRVITQLDFPRETDGAVKGYVVPSKSEGEPFVYLKFSRANKSSIPKAVDVSFLHNLPMYSRVTVEGVVLGWNRFAQVSECTLESNGKQLRVIVPTFQNTDLEIAAYRLTPGSLIRCTGVLCRPNKSRFENEEFLIRAKNVGAVVLLKDPASVYRSKVLKWVSLAAGIALAVFVWTYSLRRQVATRTKTIAHIASLLKSASEAIPDGMLIFSADSQLMAWNENVRTTLEVNPSRGSPQSDVARLVGKNLSDHEGFSAFWRSAFQDSKLVVEREFTTSDGSGAMSFYSAPIPDAQGRYLGRIWTISDTTILRQMETERLHSQKIQAIGRLAGGIAHDFNNHLAALSANLSLAVSPNVESEDSRRNHIAIAQGVVQRAAKLTKQLLGFSRQSTLDVKVVNIGEILDEVRTMMQHTLDSTIQFNVESENGLYDCRADSMQLEQVIVNLCLNARDALPNSCGSISINACNTTHQDLGDCVRVSVTDDGCGMSEELKTKIFEPFFTTKEVGAGTGLGLSIALGVIDQLGGKLECISAPGKGSQFDVYLPRFVQVQTSAISTDACNPIQSSQGRALNVLLVDDDPVLRDCGSILLSTLGHQVTCAQNGEDALRALAGDTSIKTVLLDLTMPVMSGTQTLRIIRKDFPDVRVVICSGYSIDAESLSQDADLQPDAILAKPYQVSELQRILAKCA